MYVQVNTVLAFGNGSYVITMVLCVSIESE